MDFCESEMSLQLFASNMQIFAVPGYIVCRTICWNQKQRVSHDGVRKLNFVTRTA